jgi:DNA polymerase III epsilon subunit-like protein
MNKILWVDVETTGLDPLTDHIIELGAFATDLDGRPLGHEPLSVKLLDDLGGVPEVSPEAAVVNGFNPYVWRREGVLPMVALDELVTRVDAYTIMGAQNAPFDKTFIEAACRRTNVVFPRPATYHWLDVGVLIQTRLWMPGLIERPKLSHAAAYLGLGEQDHTACADAELAAAVYERLKPEALCL